MVISAGALAVIAFLVIAFVFGHLWAGIIVALAILFLFGGGVYYRR